MRLALFRSLAARGPRSLPVELIKGGAAFDGVELSLDQLGALRGREEHVRVLCRLEPQDAADAERSLDLLSDYLQRSDAQPVELISMVAPTSSADAHLAYLRQVLPLAAQFLEAHPCVGSLHGKVTGHGRPVPTHVLGICHQLAGSVVGLSEVCDVYPPTRLALSYANLDHGDINTSHRGSDDVSHGSDDDVSIRGAVGAAVAAPPASAVGGVSDELHTVLLCTDHLVVSSELEPSRVGALWEEVWCAQQLEGANETYACVRLQPTESVHPGSPWAGLAASEQLAHAEEQLALLLRERFAQSARWREGAAARRRAEDEASAQLARRAVLASGAGPVAEAAASFGLAWADDDGLSIGKVKQRWRELALQQHPDVVGSRGSAGRSEGFLRLKKHYQVLLQACRSQV